MKVVLVTGSRAFPDRKIIRDAIAMERPDLVIAGGARGTDMLAADAALDIDEHCAEIKALWNGRRRKRAGFDRNQMMVDVAAALSRAGENVIVLAFMDLLNPTPGTQDCMRRAKSAGLRIRIVEPE